MLLIAALALSVTMPAKAQALESQIYEFAEGNINADWSGKGQLTIRKQRDGILLQTQNGTGMLLTTLGPDIHADSIVIHSASPVPSEFFFSWNLVGQNHTIFTVPFVLSTGGNETTELSLEGNWQPGDHTIGIILPPQSSLLLRSIELQNWNILEQTLEAVRSFWTFDALRPYSINFVWGPHIGWNPTERHQLYDALPPVYLSGTLAMQTVLLFTVVGIIGLGLWRQSSRKQTFRRIGFVFLCAWIMFDVRMGSEFLSWIQHDHQTYIAAEEGERVFRDRNAFYDFADYASPFVADRKSYVFFAEYPWPYLGNMRYLTYPSIPGIDYLKDDTWVIYRRSDMGVDESGRVTVDGEAVTPQGKILGQYDAHSFIFRVTP